MANQRNLFLGYEKTASPVVMKRVTNECPTTPERTTRIVIEKVPNEENEPTTPVIENLPNAENDACTESGTSERLSTLVEQISICVEEEDSLPCVQQKEGMSFVN